MPNLHTKLFHRYIHVAEKHLWVGSACILFSESIGLELMHTS